MDLPKIEAGRETVKPQNVDVSAVLRDVSNAVQNVVDDAQKELAGALDLLEIGENLDMFGPDAVFTEHLAVTNDGVKRGAQFVAHVRQKNALRAIGLLGGVARPLEFPLRTFEFAHVLRQPDVSRGDARGAAQLA